MTLAYKPSNTAKVTQALVDLLANWPTMPSNARVERSNELNETPGNCPWVGVYRDSVEFVSRTLGMGTGARNQRISLVVAVQEADSVSGDKCEDRLEELLAEVLAAILTDTTIGGTVQTIEDLIIRYADYRKESGGSFMQTAAVYLTAVVAVQVQEQ